MSMTRLGALVLVLVLGLATPAGALTTYYVAPNSTTSHTGAAATPWTDLNSAWGTINATLATDDVTVYFTARKATSDVNEMQAFGIDLNRTDGSTHRLTLDGMSFYNTSNSSPSWVAYSGASRFQVNSASGAAISSNNFGSGAQPQRNFITFRGFKVMKLRCG